MLSSYFQIIIHPCTNSLVETNGSSVVCLLLIRSWRLSNLFARGQSLTVVRQVWYVVTSLECKQTSRGLPKGSFHSKTSLRRVGEIASSILTPGLPFLLCLPRASFPNVFVGNFSMVICVWLELSSAYSCLQACKQNTSVCYQVKSRILQDQSLYSEALAVVIGLVPPMSFTLMILYGQARITLHNQWTFQGSKVGM